jgi:hypothetical protein
LHGDPGQVRRVRPDERRTVDEAHVGDPALGNFAVRTGQQDFVEAGPLGAPAEVLLGEAAGVLEVSDRPLVHHRLKALR